MVKESEALAGKVKQETAIILVSIPTKFFLSFIVEISPLFCNLCKGTFITSCAQMLQIDQYN